jgi:subtilisin
MARRFSFASILAALALVFALLTPSASASRDREGSGDRQSYIVVLRGVSSDGAERAIGAQAERYGITPTMTYRHAVQGYAADLTPEDVAALGSDPSVLFVSPDRMLHVSGSAAPPGQPPQVPSNAIFRIDADLSSTASGDGRGSVPINVAVLDSEIDTSHPDLRAMEGIDCFPRDSADDPGGHGTMVAGFVGAIDNSFGKVGVAPGARLWSVRVANSRGFIYTASAVCGIDWVTSTRTDANPRNDIMVANMSFGGADPRDPAAADDGNCGFTNRDALHVAICASVAAGVTYVASAGNEAEDFAESTPGSYGEVLTATAMADKDGEPGGLGGNLNCLPEAVDDTAAFFSNFATLPEDAAHTIAAPGACISSTFPGGLYAVGSGTSFAAPLVTGTVALCIATGECAGLTPAQIITKIIADAEAYNLANPGYGFEGDPLRPYPSGAYYGYLIHAADY